MTTKKCPECNKGTLQHKAVIHTENVGDVKVTDETVSVFVCDTCGEYDLTVDELSRYQCRAAALVLRDGRFVNKDVVQYARKALGLQQIDLAKLIGKPLENVSQWETGDMQISRTEQMALVALLETSNQKRQI